MRAPRRRATPRSGSAVLALAGLVICSTAVLLRFGPAGPQTPPPIGGPIDLVDGNGHPVHESDLRGRLTLMYFGYTDCPDICPTTLGQIADAMDRLGPAASRVRPVFITVDPARDSPEVMARYTAAISPHLLGLTGSPEAIAAAERAYHVHVQPAGNGLDHSAVIYVMGPDGRLLEPIPADTTGPAIAAAILRLLS